MNSFYASPSGEAYRDRQLIPNFELWVEIFCVPTCFHVRIPKPCLSVCLSAPRKKKSSYLRQYQSYISNWYINGKVFTSTTPWKPQNLIFFSKFEIRILTKSWNHLSFVNISPTLVIDTPMERSSRLLQHGNIKIWFKKIRNWILTCFFLSSKLNFDLCQRAVINIQVGLNMHLYDDIGDASSSLRGSTSSRKFFWWSLLK